MKKVADKINGKIIGYKLVDANGVVKFYVEDGGAGESKWNLHEGDNCIGSVIDAFPTLKAAINAANQ